MTGAVKCVSTACVLLLALYVSQSEARYWWRTRSNTGQYCPHYPITSQLKRRNTLYGRCNINRRTSNTCRNSLADCCKNSRGNLVCVIASQHDQRERTRRLRARMNRLFRDLPSPPLSSFLRDDGVATNNERVSSASGAEAIPNHHSCPAPKIICSDGHCAQECTADSLGFDVCTDTGVCPAGSICCDDPCYGEQGGQDVGKPHLKLCFPAPVVQRSTLNDQSNAVVEDTRCPRLLETCNRLVCDPNMCPEYDSSYTNCRSTDDCEDISVCCSDPCSNRMKCHPPKGLEVRKPSEARANQPDTGDDRDGSAVCPQSDLRCIHWAPIPGQPGTGTCKEDSDCRSDRLCCKITECEDELLYCVPKYELSKKPHPDCPVPHYANQSVGRAIKPCQPGSCSSNKICCDLDMQGTRACIKL